MSFPLIRSWREPPVCHSVGNCEVLDFGEARAARVLTAMAEGHQSLQPFVSASVRRLLLQLRKHKLLFVSPDIDIRPLYARIPGKIYRAYYCGTQVDARIHSP